MEPKPCPVCERPIESLYSDEDGYISAFGHDEQLVDCGWILYLSNSKPCKAPAKTYLEKDYNWWTR